MSESSVVKSRSRRRAVRSAGPPPDDTSEIEEIEERDTGERIKLSKAAVVDITMVKSAPVVANAPAETASDATDSVSEPARDIPEAADFVDTEAKGGVPRWLRMAVAAVAAAAVIALVVTSGFFIFGLRSADARARRADYEQTAKQAILNLTTINDETAKADIDRVLAVASGELKAEYTERKDAYASVVEQAKVKATGEIVETAIENEDPNSARVLIAAKQTLTNAGMKDPQTRFYRFRVTVTRGDNGITASQVEFVA
jgi:Mce-associated membrane protein